MLSSLNDLQTPVLIIFHYGASNETTDLLVDEDDPVIEALLDAGFQTSSSKNKKRLNFYLQNGNDLHKVSRITNYPYFLSLTR